MTEYESIKVVLYSPDDPKLKRDLEEYNYHHKNNKINMSDVCRKALRKEWNERNSVVCRN